MSVSWRVGQFEIIINKGAGSLMFHGSKRELILNIKPTPDEPQQLLVQLFVMKSAEALDRDQQAG